MFLSLMVVEIELTRISATLFQVYKVTLGNGNLAWDLLQRMKRFRWFRTFLFISFVFLLKPEILMML